MRGGLDLSRCQFQEALLICTAFFLRPSSRSQHCYNTKQPPEEASASKWNRGREASLSPLPKKSGGTAQKLSSSSPPAKPDGEVCWMRRLSECCAFTPIAGRSRGRRCHTAPGDSSSQSPCGQPGPFARTTPHRRGTARVPVASQWQERDAQRLSEDARAVVASAARIPSLVCSSSCSSSQAS